MEGGAGAGSALVTGKVEGGLISGVPPFGDTVGCQTPALWVSGFSWFWTISVCPALAAVAVSGEFPTACATAVAALQG